ncbi:MAG: uroporphyrinogen decarboxylase family protein [Verrucomicrobiota bacterium]
MATRRDLVERALLRQPTDRLPCFPLVDLAFGSTHSGNTLARLQLAPVLHAAALVQCLRELPIDGVYVNLCFSAKQASSAVGCVGQYTVRLDDCLRVEFTENEVAAIAGTDLLSLDDERISTAELFHPGMLETFQAMPEDLRSEAAVCVGLTGAFSQVGFLVGIQNLMVAMLDDPDGVHRAIQRRQQIALRQAGEFVRAGARFIWIGEGMASTRFLVGSLRCHGAGRLHGMILMRRTPDGLDALKCLRHTL